MRSEYAAHHYSLYCGLYVKMQKLYLWMYFNIRIMDTKRNFTESICVLYEDVTVTKIFKFTCFSGGEGGF
jgi:hypothetical protein